ncbi:SGNH/GDSL hydrolase family protein [Curtobacterium poinsettiae]|uniref:SGNH/GDSL hydrolase family protein n=1 Tax=Curtobacterium poinsettiae TaxID=159612 RepID=UPI00217D547D|nr:SGNH/GDSL hydrolase family protein [Curtobacterium flaccumfaciens]MCS6578270.1 SGNH/GDSL hydrolase family protein [Curtobacterium flaccumfaciens]
METKRSTTVRWTAVAAVAVAVIAIGGFFGHRAYASHKATAAGCSRVEEWKQETSPYLKIGDGPRTTAILGDSYSAGDDLTDRADGWVYGYAALTGERVLVNSVGYTGYVAGGYCGDDQFITRADAVADASPDRVIVQGGLNDVGSNLDEVSRAASQLVDEFEDTTEVILIGPPHAPQRAAGEKAVDGVLREVAADAHVKYVSAYSWDLEYNDEGLHLTERGHAEFAENVTAALAE